MKKPRIEDFDPTAAERKLGTPLDDMPRIIKAGAPGKPSRISAGSVSSPILGQSSSPVEARNVQVNRPGVASKGSKISEKPEKYTTHVEASLKKEIQLYAIQNDMNDYDVVRTAVREYLDSHK